MSDDPVVTSENTSEVSNASISQSTNESESTDNRYAIPQNSEQESAFRESSADSKVDVVKEDILSSSMSIMRDISIEGRRIVDLTFFWSQLHKK